MMNMFPRFELPFQMLFHDISMFSNLLSIDNNSFIFMARFPSWLKSKFRKFWQVMLSKTNARAIFRIASIYSIFWDIKRFIADQTKNCLSFFFSPANHSFFMQIPRLARARAIFGRASSFNEVLIAGKTVCIFLGFHGKRLSYGNVNNNCLI
jgi:hypothetical protein